MKRLYGLLTVGSLLGMIYVVLAAAANNEPGPPYIKMAIAFGAAVGFAICAKAAAAKDKKAS